MGWPDFQLFVGSDKEEGGEEGGAGYTDCGGLTN